MAQKINLNLWELVVTKVGIMSFVIPKVRTLVTVNHLL
jgi:hypothetical protein